MPVFDKYNKLLQNEEPQIYKLNEIYLSFYRDILKKFVLPQVILKQSADPTKIDFRCCQNQLKEKDLYLGEIAMSLLQKTKPKLKCKVYEPVKDFYYTALDYIRKKFPINDEALLNVQFVDLEKRSSATIGSVRFFLQRMPFLNISSDELHEDFSNFQTMNLPQSVIEEKRMDKAWNILLNYENKIDKSTPFKNLAKVALAVLSIPHSNATAERIFSLVRKNRNECRASMGTKALNSLLVTKVRSKNTNLKPVKLTEDVLRRCKAATKNSLDADKQQSGE